MDDDVARLAREERLLEAAELASERGDVRTASELFERACDFARAAEYAARGSEWDRALTLALEGKAHALAEEILPKLVSDPSRVERVAYQLERRGNARWAGRLFEGIGKEREAARAYERAGDALDASRLLEASGDVIGAARVLEARVRREPENMSLLVALGSLLYRYGKIDASVRTLQRVAMSAPERRAALAILVEALGRLGFAEARLEAEAELASLGGAVPIEEASARNAPVHARLFGRYEIVRDVASSPHARVVECIDGVRHERVAVKVFAAHDVRGAGRDALARFEREVRVLATLDHPNIVPLRDYVAEGPALVLAWMKGGTLEQMLTREVLAPARAAEIAQAVLSALGEAHRLGIIHRDVKPANVLFDDSGVARLGDFGVAHLSDLSTTATAGLIGTLGYMSPEQRAGRPATVQSDLYGVGAMLWEMLTGEGPESRMHDAHAALVETPSDAARGLTRPSDVLRELTHAHDDAVFALLSDAPSRRPADAFEALRLLRSLPWPHSIERTSPPRIQPKPPCEGPSDERWIRDEHGRQIDRWLDRHVTSVALDPAVLARAKVFAEAEHPALQTVLRVDRERRTIWLAAMRGAPLSQPPTPRQASSLREALERLHELGHVHGAIDPEHVWVDASGEVTLAFSAESGRAATFDLDRLALARLTDLSSV